MKRRVGVAMAIVVGLVLVVMWLLHRGGAASSGGSQRGERGQVRSPAGAVGVKRDPRIQARGSIAGTIRDEAKAPIAQARVCADAGSSELPDAVIQEPFCTNTDAEGHYQLGNLIAADYTVYAMARLFRPAPFYPWPNAERLAFPLAAGEVRTGVDVTLRHGGVEITGVVMDISGGPIAHAEVRASSQRHGVPLPAIDADELGRFSLWVDRGPIWVAASADGYCPNRTWGRAPGNFEILLTPAASVAGTVVDGATHQPVEGARVELDNASQSGERSATDVTDVDGKFRFDRLMPGRFTAVATAEHGYGRTEGSVLVGLGQHVDGVVVSLFPAHRITGTIAIASTHEPCSDGQVRLSDTPHDRRITMRPQGAGQEVADGVLPGTYAVIVQCSGYVSHDHYDPIVVANADISGLIWEVDPGARIRGKVVTKAGDPVESAQLRARHTNGSAADFAAPQTDISRPDGGFELAGLKAGTNRVDLSAADSVGTRDSYAVELAAGATVERNFILDDGGKLVGTVVDAEGTPVPGVEIFATSDGGGTIRFGANYVRPDANGGFTFDSLPPGEYQVTAFHGLGVPLRKPGAADDAKPGERVVVRAAQTATVRLVVETQTGTIRGSVVDAAGKPVGDAFVSSSRESDAAGAPGSSVAGTRDDWWGAAAPVLTATDGSFAIAHLAPGSYTLRAYRKGGGEAVAEHVAVGSVVNLQIKPTGSIEGTVRRDGGPAPTELEVSARDASTGFERDETFYRTDGHFVLRDLPAGHFEIDVAGDGSESTTTVDLHDGEAKTGVDITLAPLITVTGRLVEYGTEQPVGGMFVFAGRARGSSGPLVFDMDRAQLSDDAGRFSVPNVPAGQIYVRGVPQADDSMYSWFYAVRTATGTGTVDVGDIGVLKQRRKPGDPRGELGLRFAEQPDDTPLELRERKISWIDPAGPAARTRLEVGDVITRCDGIDVTGANSAVWRVLVDAAPGTALTLDTRRGMTATVVLAAN